MKSIIDEALARHDEHQKREAINKETGILKESATRSCVNSSKR
jgi:hypothetical protein